MHAEMKLDTRYTQSVAWAERRKKIPQQALVTLAKATTRIRELCTTVSSYLSKDTSAQIRHDQWGFLSLSPPEVRGTNDLFINQPRIVRHECLRYLPRFTPTSSAVSLSSRMKYYIPNAFHGWEPHIVNEPQCIS